MRRSQVHEGAAAGLLTEVLTTPDALEQLRPEWQRLWSEDERATPFQSPAWLLPWWKHVGVGTLASVALRCAHSGQLVGFAPLYVYMDTVSASRHLFPIGMVTTDYVDLLAAPGREGEVARALLSCLAGRMHEWDVIEFPQLRADSPLLDACAGWRGEIRPAEPHPVLPLAGEGDLPIPKSMAANLRTCRNRAARAGTVKFEQADAASLPEFLDALLRLHASRWTERGQPGVLAEPPVQACHAEAAPLLHAEGLLRLHGLRLDGELVAVLYCLADLPRRQACRCYYYIGGFDPRFATLGPGTLLVAHAIREAMKEGATGFDFLRGAELYKYRWGAVDQAMSSLRILT
jgi:CelD/BcsL family acetyltransferase involved in cellulose biosynthesis